MVGAVDGTHRPGFPPAAPHSLRSSPLYASPRRRVGWVEPAIPIIFC